MTRREALLAMGYTEAEPGRWLKPVGYNCFAYSEQQNTWKNYFKTIQRELDCYDSHVIEDTDKEDTDEFLSRLKTAEAYSRINVGDSNSEFHLKAFDT